MAVLAKRRREIHHAEDDLRRDLSNGGSVRVTGRVSALLEVSGALTRSFPARENIYFRGELLGISREELKEMEPDIVAFRSWAAISICPSVPIPAV